jgi:hypothetical protein
MMNAGEPEGGGDGSGSASLRPHLILIPAAILVLGMAAEYSGWRIIERMVGESRFPGFLSGETWKSLLKNGAGALAVGGIFCLFALPFGRFRRNWRRVAPRLVWAAIGIFYGYLGVLIWIGLRAV